MSMENSGEWQALLLILRFLDSKTNKGLEALYVDKEHASVDYVGLQGHPASSSQRFLVSLGLHLLNVYQFPLPSDGLGGMDDLDANYMAVAMKAIAVRFNYK